MYKKSKRFLAGFLALLLVVTMIPTDLLGVVYAAEETDAIVSEAFDSVDDAEEAEVLENADADDDADAEEALDENDIVKDGESVEPSEPENPEGGNSSESPEPSQPASDPQPSEPVSSTPESSEPVSEPESTPTEPSTPVEAKTYTLDSKNLSALSDQKANAAAANPYFTYVCTSGKSIKVKAISDIVKDLAPSAGANASDIAVGITGGGLAKDEQNNAHVGINEDAGKRVYGASIAFKVSTKKANVTVKFIPKNDGAYIKAAVADKILESPADVSYMIGSNEINSSTAPSTKGYTNDKAVAVTTQTFTLAGTAGTNYYVGFSGGGGIITSIEVKELPDVPVQTISDVELSMDGVSDFNATKKAPYTGEARIPDVTVKAGSTTLSESDYKVAYARKTADSEPADSDYKEASDIDFTSLGTVYVKVSSNSVDYEGTKIVTYEIVKGVAPAAQNKEEVVDVSKASTDEVSADSMAYEIDLNRLFTFDEKYGDPIFKNVKVEGTNNVLDSSVTPAIKADTTDILAFNTKATVPADTQQKATIKVDAEFENYETVTLTIEVSLSSKKAVTITGITVADKTYDGVAVTPDTANLSIMEGTNDVKSTLADELVYTYAVKDGEVLTEAPKNAGNYTLTVSVPSSNSQYSGEAAPIAFEIKAAPLTITVKDRTWTKDYAVPETTAPEGKEDLWYEITGLVNNETLASLNATLTFAYKVGNEDVNWETVTKEAEVAIVPVTEGLDNYDITAVNGKLTVEEEAPLGSNEHELNFTKTTRDPYFTKIEGAMKDVTSSGNQMVYYDKYTKAWKGDSKLNVEFTAPKDSKVEIIYYLASSNTSVLLDGTAVTGVKIGEGTKAAEAGSVAEGMPIYKATVTASADGVHSIKRGSSGEFFLYYVKVTEPGGSVGGETVSVTPSISAEDLAKLDGAKVYFTATGETDVEVGTTAVTLKKGVTYTLVVKNADGTVSNTLTAQINGNLSYTPSTDGNVTITIVDNGENPPTPDKKVKITPTISDPDNVLGEAKVAFVNPKDKAEQYIVTSGQELELPVGVTYKLAILNGPDDKNLGAKINGSDTYTVPEEAASVTINIAVVPVVKYKVTLADEAGNKISETEVEEGKEFKFPDATNKKDGYFFAGWKSEDSDRAYGKDETYTIESDITFKETWVQAGKEDLTVKFYDYTESEIPSLAKTIKAGDSPVITLPEAYSKRVGYTFEGWYDSEEGNTYKAGATYTVKSNVSFTEYWEEEDIPETGMVIRVDEYEAYYQGGKAVTPYVSVYYKGNELTLGTDYTVKYKNNKNAGTATVTVTGKNNYAKAVKKDVQFTIRPADIYDLDYADEMTVIKDTKFTPIIMCNGKALKANKDYTLSDANKDSGFDAAKCRYTKVTDKAVTDDKGNVTTPAKYNTLVLTGKGNYKGTAEVYVTVIDKTEAKKLGVEIDKTFKPTYGDNITWGEVFGETQTSTDGKEEFKVGKVKVYDKKDSAKTALVRNKDFMVVSVSGDLSSAGTYKFMIVGMGAYSGSVTKSIKIAPKKTTDIKAGVLDDEKNEWYPWNRDKEPVFLAKPTAVYDNSKAGARLYDLTVVIKITEKDSDGKDITRWQELSNGWDYKVSYSANKKVGNAKAKISFINNYKGTAPITVEYAVTGDILNYTNIKVPDMTYTKAGKAYKSKPIVEYNGTILKASEYTASYEWSSASDVTVNETTKEETRNWTKDDDKVKITIKDGDSYAIVKVTIKPNSKKSNFVLNKRTELVDGKETEVEVPIEEYYYVRKADNANAIDLSKAKVTFYSDPECKTQLKKIPFRDVEFWTPEGNVKPEEADESAVYVKVEVNKAVVDPKLYDVTWLCAQYKGKATVVITGNGPSETTVTPAPAAESSPTDGSTGGSDSGTTSGTKFAVGGKTATIAIDSIGAWIEPKTVAEKAKNLLKKLF